MSGARYLVAVVLVCYFTVGMGSMGREDTIRIPDVEENYSVRLIDQSDASVTLEKFSFDGQTFLLGKFGKAQISIGFDKIAAIYFLLQESEVKANVILKNGEEIEIFIGRKKSFYGKAPFADLRIEAQDVKTVTFDPKR